MSRNAFAVGIILILIALTWLFVRQMAPANRSEPRVVVVHHSPLGLARTYYPRSVSTYGSCVSLIDEDGSQVFLYGSIEVRKPVGVR